jgi:hypothetical protein
MFVRFQSAVPNRHGWFPGVFALANGLHASGRFSEEDAQWWRQQNDHANAAYTDPSTVEPDCYAVPGSRAWFKVTAGDLLDFSAGYLALLDRYEVRWVELRTATPGHLTYEDEVQVVARPFRYADDWPFPTSER